WNRFVPSLDGYIQDRLNNPIHLPGHGTLKTLRLEAPPPELVRCIVEARLRPALVQLPDHAELEPTFPFTAEQIERVPGTAPTLCAMRHQFRNQCAHVVYAPAPAAEERAARGDEPPAPAEAVNRLTPDVPGVKSVVVVQTPANAAELPMAIPLADAAT